MLELVKCVRGFLSKLETISFNAIIVIDVHAKNVIETLIEKDVGK